MAISVENRQIFAPRVFYPRTDELTFGIEYRRKVSKKLELNIWLKKFQDRFRRLDTNTGVCQTDRQTDIFRHSYNVTLNEIC